MANVVVTSSGVATISVTPSVAPPSVSATSASVRTVNVSKTTSPVQITMASASTVTISPTTTPSISVTQSIPAPITVTGVVPGPKGDQGIQGPAGGVSSVNSLTGGITLSAGDNVSISDDGSNTVTISSSSTGGGETDLSKTVTSSKITVISSSGDDVDLDAATTTDAGLLTAAKFDEIELNNSHRTGSVTGHSDVTNAGSGAIITADERTKLEGVDDRANHTGNQPASTISDFDTEVANNSAVSANSDKVSADGSVGTHSNVDLTGLAVNDVLKWNGTSFVSAGVDESFVFSWDKVVYDNNVDDVTDTSPTSDRTSTILNGTGNHITSIDVTHTLSNSVEGSFVSGSTGSDNLGIQTRDISESGFTGRANLSYSGGSPNASVSVNMAFPSSLTSNSYNRIKTQFKYDSTTYDHELKYLYKNYMYLGKHTDDTPTDQELQDFQYDEFINNGTSNTTDISAKGVSLNDTSQHIQFWYPNRITTTPSFSVGSSAGALNAETWTAISGTISHTNSAGFTETYRGWKSPNPLDNTGGVNTWYIEVTF